MPWEQNIFCCVISTELQTTDFGTKTAGTKRPSPASAAPTKGVATKITRKRSRTPSFDLGSEEDATPPKKTKTIECLGRCNPDQHRRRGPVELARRHTHFLSLPSGAMLLARQSLRRQERSSPTGGGKCWLLPCDGAEMVCDYFGHLPLCRERSGISGSDL